MKCSFLIGKLSPQFPKVCNFLTAVPRCQQFWWRPESELFFIPKNRYLGLFSSSSFLNYSNQKRSRCEASIKKPQILQKVANRSLLPKLMSPPGSTEDCRVSISWYSFLLLCFCTPLIYLTKKLDSVEVFIRNLIPYIFDLRDEWFKLLNRQDSCTCMWENIKKVQLLQYCRSHAGFKALHKRILLPPFYKRNLSWTFLHFTLHFLRYEITYSKFISRSAVEPWIKSRLSELQCSPTYAAQYTTLSSLLCLIIAAKDNNGH